MSSIPPLSGASTAGSEPEPFRATTLSASLTVRDLKSSLDWYRDVLGFTVARTFERAGTLFAASLRAGAVPILLTQDDGAKGADRVKGEGISLQLTTAQNIDELAARVRERGGTLTSEPADVMGARMFRLRDPDGFKLVISSER
ncbi:MAG: Glyoxalase-like domain protein [Gemmatimonadetes bacterium]|nr:Glyoxalase-like domain protein [Gemmatimonadota bacterium]